MINLRNLVLLSATLSTLACGGESTNSAEGDAGFSEHSDAALPDEPADYQAGVEVDVEGGELHGIDAGDLRVFWNIPFAAPPVDDLRFRDPEAVVSWDGVRDATVVGPSCPQGLALAGPGGTSEDCLQLNVWAYDDAKLRPVMVFIHGGAFFGGSATQGLYDAENLARRGDVTIVSINYRLGVLGFLSSPLLAADAGAATSGNYGLKDQVAALEWVQRNIEIFGGDPDNVTVFGESAGAISICGLMASPAADGLYHKAIIESGIGCAEFAEADQPTSLGQPSAHDSGAALIADFGCADHADPVACLRALDTSELVGAIDAGGLILGGLDKSLPVSPHVDGVFMTDQPIARMERGDYDVPTMLGTNLDEGTLFFGATTIVNRFDFWLKVKDFLGSDEVADGVLDIYSYFDYPIAKSAFLAFVTDFAFSCPNVTLTRALAGGEPAYMYEFRRVTPQFVALGSFHAFELTFIFGNFSDLSMVPLSADLELAETMQQAWSSFAHEGHPALSSEWPAFAEGTGEFAVLNEPPSIEGIEEFRGGRCAELSALGLGN